MKQDGTVNGVSGGMERSDAQLVGLARAGDKGAFVEIVARHQTMVCGIAFGILNDFAASEDVAQETFFTAYRKLADIREPNHLRAWLAQITRNTALAKMRRRGLEEPLASDFEAVDETAKPDDAAALEEQNILVRKALEKLPEQYRLPLVLFYCEGHATQAVAEALGLSDDAVRQRLSRGREMLRSHLEGVVETVLQRRRPTALFTMTIAAGIGAMVAPPTVAMAAFASASPLKSFLSAMSLSKSITATAAAIVLISIPVGYHFVPAHGKPAEPVSAIRETKPVGRERRADFEESALVAEWRALRQKFGTSAEAMPAIHQAIATLADPFRKSVFTTALIAEWTHLDPQAAVAFFSDKSRRQREREQLFREWFRVHPRQALASVPDTKEWREILQDSLKEVALRVPDMVGEVMQRLPKKENFYDRCIRDAFGVLAERDLASARTLAENLRVPNQQDALAGIAEVWARSDLDAAIAWARELDVDADEVIRSALVGVASINPIAALERISSVPPGGRETYGTSTTGARVLQAASRADFEQTVSWLKAHPGGLSREDLLGLSEAVTERLMADGQNFLTRHENDGSITVLVDAIGSALMNRAAGAGPAVWEWLQHQPPSDALKALRTSVLNIASWHDPEFALELVKELPTTPEGAEEVREVARSLLNGGHYLERFENLYATAPERLREPLLEQAFKSLSADYMQDPHVWLSRVSLLPKEKQVDGVASVAWAWANQTPEEAALWAMSQPLGTARAAAIAKIASTWAARDEHAAHLWLGTLSGEDRKAAEESIKKGVRR